ncbi:hypothetical protein P3T76_002296 [Phytophthora citrophthora]|uniref:Kazal-like domain-containing protein n=1 Tax=Phytophthora citrophthora TaxID=4793 RepID=A0AAD9GXV4_9STRA|nr:hypothetical protein P3T76_002294 [Phytophthora citrophthora]KAK1946744.1 hypothetical protein P3T76_002296 [Phytophthora citrophthora]
MKFAILPVLASLLIVGGSAQGFECGAIDHITCIDDEAVCASNGVTYRNGCEFHKTNCDNKGM